VLFLVSIAVGIVAGLVSGGKLARLMRLDVRGGAVVIAILAIRVITQFTPLRSVEGLQYVFALTLAAAAAWCIWNLDRLPSLALVALGAVLNLAAIVANGGRMPVSPDVATVRAHVVQYIAMTPDTRLNWLADWIGLPGTAGSPWWGAYSPGDLVISAGALILVVLAMRSQTRLAETDRRIVSDPP
jgi:Family of unknown function (DUF5317)